MFRSVFKACLTRDERLPARELRKGHRVLGLRDENPGQESCKANRTQLSRLPLEGFSGASKLVERIKSLLCYYGIEGNIPGFGNQCVDFLTFMGHTNKRRRLPVPPVTKV